MNSMWTIHVGDDVLAGIPQPMADHLQALANAGSYKWWFDPTTFSTKVTGDDSTRDLGTWLTAAMVDLPAAVRLHRERHPEQWPVVSEHPS